MRARYFDRPVAGLDNVFFRWSAGTSPIVCSSTDRPKAVQSASNFASNAYISDSWPAAHNASYSDEANARNASLLIISGGDSEWTLASTRYDPIAKL